MFGLWKRFTTIDIGSYSIKVVRMMKKRDELIIIDTRKKELPLETVKDGKIVDKAIIASKLEEIFNEMNYQPNKIITTIPSDNLIIRTGELPLMEERELAEAIKWEAGEFLPFPVGDAVMDYLIQEKGKKMQKVLLTATKNEVIESYLNTFAKLYIRPAVINIQPMALLSLVHYQEEIIQPVAIIDFGASGTRVIIGNQNDIFLSRTIDIGGDEITRLLMEEKHLKYYEAENYKKEKGFVELKERDDPEYFLVLRELASTGMGSINYLEALTKKLAAEVSRSFDYYLMKYRGKKVNKVYFTGGGFRLKGLKEIICREIGIESALIDPTKKMKVLGSTDISTEFSVAVGLGVSEVTDR